MTQYSLHCCNSGIRVENQTAAAPNSLNTNSIGNTIQLLPVCQCQHRSRADNEIIMNESVKSHQSTGEFSPRRTLVYSIFIVTAFLVSSVGCASITRLSTSTNSPSSFTNSVGVASVSTQSGSGIDVVVSALSSRDQFVDGTTTWRPDVGQGEQDTIDTRRLDRLDSDDHNKTTSPLRNPLVDDSTIFEEDSIPPMPVTIRTIQIERIKREILRYLGLIEAPKDSWNGLSMSIPEGSVGRSDNLVLPKPLRGHRAAAFVDKPSYEHENLELIGNPWRSDSTSGQHASRNAQLRYEEMSDADLSEMNDDPLSYNTNDDHVHHREYDTEDSFEDDFYDDDHDNYLPPKTRKLVIFGDERKS